MLVIQHIVHPTHIPLQVKAQPPIVGQDTIGQSVDSSAIERIPGSSENNLICLTQEISCLKFSLPPY